MSQSLFKKKSNKALSLDVTSFNQSESSYFFRIPTYSLTLKFYMGLPHGLESPPTASNIRA